MKKSKTVDRTKLVSPYHIDKWSLFGFVYANISHGDAYGSISSGELLQVYFGASVCCSLYIAYRRENHVGGPFDATFADLLKNLAIFIWLLILARVDPMSTTLGPMLFATVFGILLYCISHSIVYGKRLWKVQRRQLASRN